MNPIENFEQRLLLAHSMWVAHALRCLDKAGLLDDDARRSIHLHLADLATDAEAIPEGEPVLAHFDLIVQIFPPPPRD
ncbi:MAG TPA: hypothetical protein VMN38_11710 [Sphingomicrobium sp.]|nr:hypothetical protein [Sphingomicrobium sp.]